jgi:GDPmannose 4,6-dehydratase
VARIKAGLIDKLPLGNHVKPNATGGMRRDYVKAMWMMLQAKEPANFVIATGRMHSVEDLARIAFGRAGLNWKDHVEIDPKLVRPAEVDTLLGNAAKAKAELGWEPETSFEDMISMMVDADLERVRRAQHLRDSTRGHAEGVRT